MTPDEQARLEQFLEWRRVEGRGPRLRWRWVPWVAGTLIVGLVLGFGAAILIAAVTLPAGDVHGRVALTSAERLPLERLKRWAEYVPEVRVGKAIVRWVHSQTLADAPAPADARPPQPGSPPRADATPRGLPAAGRTR